MPLDHTAFPFIIDLVLSHCTPDTLLAFSSTCLRYRVRLADQLHHSALDTDGGVACLRPVGLASAPALPVVPALVRVLDIHQSKLGFPEVTDALAVGPQGGSFEVDLLRRIGTPTPAGVNLGIEHFADTLVQYINVEDWDFPIPFEGFNNVHVELGTSRTRHILHLRWCDDTPLAQGEAHALAFASFNFEHSSFNFEHSDEHEYVFVLHPWATGHRPSASSARALLLNIIWDEIHLMSDRFAARLTFVGVEATDLDVGSLGDVEAVDERVPDLFRPFAASLEYYIDDEDYGPAEKNVAALRRVTRYLTMEEWRAELDDDEVRLVGEWVEPAA
ncbi:hypothetical protein Q8F55_000036 [Vanrija albida]|uniref:F-box domain-containing protein n=1 Tax=Vanrija albida TaxID=181172 RepID=A0ABR3QCQ2_9TREE